MINTKPAQIESLIDQPDLPILASKSIKLDRKCDINNLVDELKDLNLANRSQTTVIFENLFEMPIHKKNGGNVKPIKFSHSFKKHALSTNSSNRIENDQLVDYYEETSNQKTRSNFIRNLSKKLKSTKKSRRHTTSLGEILSNPASIEQNSEKTLRDCNHSYKLNEVFDCDNIINSETGSALNLQMVPNADENESSFENFKQLNFYKQCNLVTNWFKSMNEENKNSLLTMFLDHCGPNQNHLFSLKIVQPHSDCAPNCCDMISYLPKMISLKIFSYLDPISLARSCQVNKLWNELACDSLLWKKFCLLSRWRFSATSETKQLLKYKFSDGYTDWKSMFAERFRVKRNWLTGKSFIKTFYGHEGAVSCVQFDDTRIVAGSAIGTIKVWNISESNSSTSVSQSSLMPYLNLFGHSGTIRCLHLDGSQSKLFSGSADHTIKVWDLSEVHPTWSRVTCKMTFLGHTDTVRCLQVNGLILISGSYDNTLKIWNLETGICTNTLRGHSDSVLCLQFDHEKIISGSADRTIRIWNFEGKCLTQLEGHTGSVTCLHFDSQRIISGSLDFDIKFWQIDSGVCINTLNWITKEGHTGAIRCLKADSQKIVSCSDDKTIKIWNIETGERYVTLKNHSDGVTCLSFNDYYILSGSYDRTIKLWDFSFY